jgi:hypothetical protein
MHKLNLDAPFNSLSLGNVSLNFVRELMDKDIELNIFPVGQSDFSAFDKLPEETLKKYEGKYDFEEIEHMVLEIKLEDGQLVVYQDGENNGALYPESETVFFSYKKSAESFEFKKNEKNSFDALMDFKGAKWEGVRL